MKKIPLKKIIIVLTVVLAVPVIALAMTMTADPKQDDHNIKISADDKTTEAASGATSGVPKGTVGNLDGTTSATSTVTNNTGKSNNVPEAVSSATVKAEPSNGSSDEDQAYENDDEDDD